VPKLMNKKEATGGKNRSRLVTRASLTITSPSDKRRRSARANGGGVCGMIIPARSHIKQSAEKASNCLQLQVMKIGLGSRMEHGGKVPKALRIENRHSDRFVYGWRHRTEPCSRARAMPSPTATFAQASGQSRPGSAAALHALHPALLLMQTAHESICSLRQAEGPMKLLLAAAQSRGYDRGCWKAAGYPVDLLPTGPQHCVTST
jgi:hypothetical protein